MDLRERAVAMLVAVGVLLLALVLQQLAVIPAILADPALAFDPGESSRLGIMLFLPLNFIGLGMAALIYVRLAGKGWDWIDLGRPGRWDALWMVGGVVITLIALVVIGVFAQALDAEPPEQALMQLIQEDAVLILYMIAMVWLLNAPAEELVFRNVMQKRLYTAFSGVTAVVLTSLLFGVIHVLTFVFVGEELLDVFFPILGIFVGSLVMGYAYLRTENLLVPIVIHSLYNTFQLAILLIVLLYDIDTEASASSLAVVITLL